MRVLLIEDDPMIGRAVVAGLQDAGYTVDWVRDGAEAELALGHRVYDLTLLDLGLPRRDGVELLKGLRRDGSSLPVVIITPATRSPTAWRASTWAPTTTW